MPFTVRVSPDARTPSFTETVVKAHGGTIIGKNRSDRKGAEFIFNLPLKEGEILDV